MKLSIKQSPYDISSLARIPACTGNDNDNDNDSNVELPVVLTYHDFLL